MLVVFTEMYHTIISVVSIFCVFYLKNADCEVVYPCYKFTSGYWEGPTTYAAVTNIWCEHYCKDAGANYQYSGTILNKCYCLADKSHVFDETLDHKCLFKYSCPGNNSESCGFYYIKDNVRYEQITVSKIDRTTETVTEKNTQATSTTAVSKRDSAMTEFINMITSDTSSTIATRSTPYTTRELSSTTSQNANNDISLVSTETSTQATPDRTTVTGTEKNTQATSATYVSTGESAMTEFIDMITSDTSSAIATKSTPYTTQELSSRTSQNANNDISPIMTEISTQVTTGLSTETVTVPETNKEATRTTPVSRRESTTTEFIRMITNDTTPLIVTQRTPDTIQELLSTTNENVVTATSTVMTETSTQTTTANGEWSTWNDWTFCEVNCVREDTTNGTQSRRRTCNGSKCSGDYMEERACSEPEICKGMRPRKLLCKCPKRLINTKWHNLDGKNITDAEVKKIVLHDFNKNIKSEISVDKKTVSKETRKKTSSVDKRKSSQSIGWGCIVFLVLPMVFLIAIDILNCCIHFRSRFGGSKRNRISPISNTKVQRDSTKPLQENVMSAESYYASRCGNNFHPDEMKRETYQGRRDDNNQLGRDKWLQYM